MLHPVFFRIFRFYNDFADYVLLVLPQLPFVGLFEWDNTRIQLYGILESEGFYIGGMSIWKIWYCSIPSEL